MKKLFLITLILLAAACHKAPREIPVTKIEFEPATLKMFPGDQQAIQVKCYPENATNLSELKIINQYPAVAEFQDGKLTAKTAGATKLFALCGDAKASLEVSVYSGWFTKGGVKYGVDEAVGYYYSYGQSQPQEMEIRLTCKVSANESQNFKVWIKCSNLGKEMDITKGLDEGQISVYKNQNEDGYCLPYDSDGKPVVMLADWGDTDATLTKGLLTVTSLGGDNYSISADFALSNGYTFTVNWEGLASMKREG